MKVLDIGSGHKKIEIQDAEIVRLDFYDKTHADIICNLEEGKLPFKDNEFDIVSSRHTLEHVKNLLPIINEMWRVTKPGGIIKIIVPYFASSLAHSSIDHVRFFSYTSFDPYTKEAPTHYNWHPVTFKVKVRYIFSTKYGLRTIGKIIDFITNKIPRIYQRLFCFILPTSAISYELEVVK